MTLKKINLSINDFKEIDINQLISEEQYFYDASRAFMNNNSEILREIDTKNKIVISKIVFSKGRYYKFTITAEAKSQVSKSSINQTAAGELGLGAGPRDSAKTFGTHQPVFQLTGYCQDPSIHFHPTTLFYYELDSIMKFLATKEVLPPYMSMSHIRSFEDMSKYLLFPFM